MFTSNLSLYRGARLNQRTDTGMTPIMAAAVNGDLDTVEFLIDSAAQLHNKDLKDQSIIHLAAQHDQHDVSELILDHQRTERDFMVNENDQYVGSQANSEAELDLFITIRTILLSTLPARMDSWRL